MSSVAYFSFTWTDSRLSWDTNPVYSSDISAIYSTESKIFTPPIVVENSVSNLGLISDLTLPIKIHQTGKITWSPGDIYETSCDIDTSFYPFDEQTCVITLTTRGYSKYQLSLTLDMVPIVLTAYQENGEWTLVSVDSTTSKTFRDLVPYSQINFSFTFKRRNAFHLMNTIIPMFLLVGMTCFVFKIPVDAGEKLGYSLTVLLAFAVYLTMVADNIPTTSTNISYLAAYLNVMLALGVSAVLFAIYVINIHLKPEEEAIPGYLRSIAKLSSKVCCLKEIGCCCKKDKTKVTVIADTENENMSKVSKGYEENEQSFTWQEIAKIMDMLLFRIYLFLFIFMTLAFVIIMTIGSLI
ncbi:acetylcholine receptor subunit beta-like [Saccostrea echinata]|uniref:acetylcholine receptor subunit beta-like n=1 Tax=Saccostrea echinata TaxID=191078 RepID=UPI002A8220A2|nr:acetylcholine receptor subunit beta-like [Saccostrea echinata]